MNENEVSSFSVGSSSYQTGNPSAIYYFTVVPKWMVPQSSELLVVLPTDVTTSNDDDTEGNCGEDSLSGFTNNDIDCKLRYGVNLYV